MSVRIEWICSECGAYGEVISVGKIDAQLTCIRCGTPVVECAFGTGDFTIFTEAEQTINGPRAEDYGDANESFNHIAALWGAYLNYSISAADVAMLMSLLKMVRLKYSKFAHHDSFVDLLGYVGLAHKVSGEK